MMIISSHNEEEKLLQLLRKGDTHAFERLYYTYSPRLYGNILKMVKATDTAQDLLQELFQRIWEKRETIDPTKSFKSFLYTIAKNLVYDFFYRQTKQRHFETYLIAVASECYRHVEEDLEHKETNSILQEAICQLSPQRKLIYTLCKIEGKSYQEVAQLLGISTSTINDHIVKATKILKAYYMEHALTMMIAAQISL